MDPQSPPAPAPERLIQLGFVEADAAALDRYSRTTGVRTTRPLAIARPGDLAEVQRLVACAGELGLALYPISRGCNWGYGDACAATSGQVIVDLSRMNRIVRVDEESAYAVIEPGVTQGQLWQYLSEHHPHLWMDATGAGRQTSIVGNALDRGFGHTRYGDRMLNTCGMQVVLADGRVLHTGFGHYENAKANHVYRYGIGPSLDGLFVQSNLGIVTQMAIHLMPRPEAFCMFAFMSPDEQSLELFVEQLRPLRLQGLLQSAIHIANDLRLISARMRYPWERAGGATPLPPRLRQQLRQELGVGAWSGCGGLYGTRRSVAAAKAALRSALRGQKLVFINDRKLRTAATLCRMLRPLGVAGSLENRLELVRPAYELLKGKPSDEALLGAAWRVRGEVPTTPADPRDIHAGLLWTSPVLPMNAAAAREVVQLLEPIYEQHGFEMLATFTMITERAMVCVTNLAFHQRDEQERTRAAACHSELNTALRARGYHPYRTGSDSFAKLAAGSSVFWDVVSEVKGALDPQNTISPGRYALR